MAAGGQSGICDNFLAAVGSSQDPENFSVKVDHRWSDKSSYFGEVLFSPGKYNNYRVPWTGATFPNDSTGWGSQYPVDFANLDIGFGNTYTFTPTLVNEFRASFTRQFLNSHPNHPYPNSITDQNEVQQLLAPIKIPQDPQSPTPNWIMSVPGGETITFGPTQWVNMITMAESYNLLDNITKVAGKHTVKAGVTYRLEHAAYKGRTDLFLIQWRVVAGSNLELGRRRLGAVHAWRRFQPRPGFGDGDSEQTLQLLPLLGVLRSG